MKRLQPVIWMKGTMLSPQYLQTQDRFLENSLKFQLDALTFAPWGFRRLQWNQESLAAMQLAVDFGCNFFDTAWAYGEGKSDALLGKILAANRDKRLYAASKVPPRNEKWPASPKDKYHDVFPAEHVFKYAKSIREKLGVDSIDLLQFHVWDDIWAKEAEFRETSRAVRTTMFRPSTWVVRKQSRSRPTARKFALLRTRTKMRRSAQTAIFSLCPL